MYSFPPTKFIANSEIKQLEHVCTEVAEVAEAFLKADTQFNTAAEVWDVIHSCETLLRIMENAGADVSAAKMYVEGKNRARGYYGDTDMS